jgi:hypothetical protein
VTCNYVNAMVCQVTPERRIAFNIVSNFRMHATSATRPGLPAALSRFQNARTVGLQRIADTECVNEFEATGAWKVYAAASGRLM